MGRIKLQISKEDLLKQINNVETEREFRNRNELAEYIANTDWGKNFKPKPITASVVILRIEEFNLGSVIKTPKGKRGRQSGIALSAEQKAAMQAGRQQKSISKDFIDRLKKNTPVTFHNVINRIQSGSIKAAIKLHCLQCSGYERNEVKHCQCLTCPLYAIRPYQIKDAV